MKTYYLVYKIVNKINGKYYIGVHKTKNKDDGYMGSGKAIIRAEKKYGIQNFEKIILFECSSEEEMFKKEKELVTEDVVKDRMSYNMKPGGIANFYYINNNGLNHSKNQHLIHGNKIKTNAEYAKMFSEKMKDISRKNKEKRRLIHSGFHWMHNPMTHKNKQVKNNLI